MSNPAQHLRDYLVNTVGGVHTATTTFWGGETPPTPDALTMVRDTPGLAPQEFFGAETTVEKFGIQVIARANTAADAVTRAYAAYDALRRLTHVTISGTRYVSIVPISPPFAIGNDEAHITSGGATGRPMWSVNFTGERER